jgi:hypothetical protein
VQFQQQVTHRRAVPLTAIETVFVGNEPAFRSKYDFDKITTLDYFRYELPDEDVCRREAILRISPSSRLQAVDPREVGDLLCRCDNAEQQRKERS